MKTTLLTRRVVVFLVISAAPAEAQLANNTVTVTASQISSAQPDEAVFSVNVSSGADTSFDDVVAAVSGVGITAADLVGIGNPPFTNRLPATAFLYWGFQLVVPISKLKDTMAALTALEKTISQNGVLTLDFTMGGTRASGQQTSACNLAGLVAQARAQAQDIASAAGLNAGVIVGLTSATSNGTLLGCSLTARFALGAMFGQPGPNSITITATRTNNIQPDQVLVGLNVTSGTTAGLDDITGVLRRAGISGEAFTGVSSDTVYNNYGTQTVLYWSFTQTEPLAQLAATLTKLSAAMQAVWVWKNPGVTFTFSVEGTQASPQLQQSQLCSQAALLADAQAQAKQVASAAGVSAGPILSMGSVGSVPAGYTPQTTCSLTVQFQLM
jgi:uncharacterized protein YggE